MAIDNIELTQSTSTGGLVVADSTDSRLFNGKGRKGKRSKGKGKARTTEVDPETPADCIDTTTTTAMVEELLASGDLHKDEVTQILFRLPDGTRLQKSFLSKHPISVSVLQGKLLTT